MPRPDDVDLYNDLLDAARLNCAMARTGEDTNGAPVDNVPDAFRSAMQKNCAQAALALVQAAVTLEKGGRR